MTSELNILALIPARSGSKRVQNKNLRMLGGKPLIAYSIECARASRFITRVIVTTDSDEIASVSRKYGAETPFIRPSEISQDGSTEYEFHVHALQWLKENESYRPDLVANLYPTSPFRKPETLDEAISSLVGQPEADSLRSVRKCSEHPYKMWTRNGKYLLPFVSGKNGNTHTLSYQLLPEVFIQNASIYITRPSTLEKFRNTLGEKVLGFVMSEEESVDINSHYDLQIAEIMIKDGKTSGR